MKCHLKRIATPRTWPILRKSNVFITRPKPGAHKLEHCMPLSAILKDLVDCGIATTKEAKKVIDQGKVLVDGKKAVDYRRAVGLMDVVSLPELKAHYRIVLDSRGKLAACAIDEKEAGMKIVTIKRKHVMKGGKVQLTLSDSRNIVSDDKNHRVGDGLLLTLPDQKVKTHLPLKEGQYGFLIGGKHIGKHGSISSIDGENVKYVDADKNESLTRTKYIMVVGASKPEVTLQ